MNNKICSNRVDLDGSLNLIKSNCSLRSQDKNQDNWDRHYFYVHPCWDTNMMKDLTAQESYY